MFGMSWADTLRIVLMGIFILVCRKASRMVFQVQSVVQQTHTGVRTRDVLWKESL